MHASCKRAKFLIKDVRGSVLCRVLGTLSRNCGVIDVPKKRRPSGTGFNRPINPGANIPKNNNKREYLASNNESQLIIN